MRVILKIDSFIIIKNAACTIANRTYVNIMKC